VSNSLDQDEMPSHSTSHPDQSFLHMAICCDLRVKG